MSKSHSVGIWPEFFSRVISGKKPYEIRKNDRGYEVGDTILLRELDTRSDEYTGRAAEVSIVDIMPLHNVPGLLARNEWVVMTIELVNKPEDPRLLQMIKRAYDAGVCPGYQGIQCSSGRGKDCLRCWLEHLNARQHMPTCRECGCTDDNACDGGCSWVEPDLCSACDVGGLDELIECPRGGTVHPGECIACDDINCSVRQRNEGEQDG